MTEKRAELVVVRPHAEMITPKYDSAWADHALRLVEECGRVSHKSEDRIESGSAAPFIRKVGIKWKHESILEHAVFTACFVGSRSMSHQLVRHRLAAFTQESQRYCDYAPAGEESGRLRVIVPPSIAEVSEGTVIRRTEGGGVFVEGYQEITHKFEVFCQKTLAAYEGYQELRLRSVPSEDARELLPNATKTEVYTTFNLRQWRHVFKMRLDAHAQWQIRGCVRDVFEYFKENLPLVTEGVTTLGGEVVE